MDKIESKIRAGLCRNICPNCNNELSVIFNGLFGKTYERVKKSTKKQIINESRKLNIELFLTIGKKA